MVPPYVDAHLHLDYVYTGRNDGATNDTGTLFEGIARWHDVKKHQTYEDAKERALRGIQEEVSKGVQCTPAPTCNVDSPSSPAEGHARNTRRAQG